MAFWNRSEDPWDGDPPRPPAEGSPAVSPLDALRDWNEGRKAKAAAKRAELEAQPKEVCPWCGREMERGYLEGGKGIWWYPGLHIGRAAWIGPPPEARDRQLRVDDEGVLATYKTAWYCRDCRRMTFYQEEPGDPPTPYEGWLGRHFEAAEDVGEEDAP